VFKQREYDWRTRTKYGLFIGALLGVILTIYGNWVRHNEGSELMSLQGIFIFVVGQAVFVAVVLQKWPETDDRDVREILDDPDNVSANQRVRAARSRHEKTRNK
jgi:Na+/proline symporter